MNIRTISKGSSVDSDAALTNLAVSEFIKGCPLADYLQFYSIVGNADSPRKVDAQMSAGDARAIGSDYTAKTNTPGFSAIALKIYGDKVSTDIAYQRRGIDIGSQRAVDLANFANSLGRYFMDALFNHTLSATHFSGFSEQATALTRNTLLGTSAYDIFPLNDSASNKAKQYAFFETLDAMINDIMGGPDCIVMNGSLLSRLESAAKDFIQISNMQDIYGANQVIKSYKGIPLVNAGYKANATDLVIGNAETYGNKSDCTSLYLLKFGEMKDCTLATNRGLDVKNLGLVATSFITMVEFDVDLGILNNKAFSRLSGIRLAQS
jgi:hypothetical protein